MKQQAYRLFEIVAWPAAAWCGFEVMVRAAAGPRDGLAASALLGILAAGTIAACRVRTRQLRLQASTEQ